jgi:hypothetical protein
VIGSLEKTKISLGGIVASLVIGRARKFIVLSAKLSWKTILMSDYECLCVACGTQCEVCLERYPSACTCPVEED